MHNKKNGRKRAPEVHNRGGRKNEREMHNIKRAKAGDRIAPEHKKEAAHSKMSAKCTIKNGRNNRHRMPGK